MRVVRAHLSHTYTMNLESLFGKPDLSIYCPDTCIQFSTVEISIRSHRRPGVRTAEAKKLRPSTVVLVDGSGITRIGHRRHRNGSHDHCW